LEEGRSLGGSVEVGSWSWFRSEPSESPREELVIGTARLNSWPYGGGKLTPIFPLDDSPFRRRAGAVIAESVI
jgi:hypothetical protein